MCNAQTPSSLRKTRAKVVCTAAIAEPSKARAEVAAHHARLLQGVRGHRSRLIAYSLVPRLHADGMEGLSLSRRILNKLEACVLDAPLLPGSLVPHNQHGYALPIAQRLLSETAAKLREHGS